MTEPGMEAPVDDAIEQHRSVRADDEDETDAEDWTFEVPLDVDEADKAEQGRTVELDEDDYR
jgi:hypothetical protein